MLTDLPESRSRIRVVRDLAEFERLEQQWDAFVDSVGRPSPFLVHGWLVERWRRVGDAAVVVSTRNERIVAAVPLSLARSRGVRIGAFLAGPYAGLDLPLAEGESPDVARAVLAEARRLVNVLEVFGLADDSMFERAWQGRLPLIRLSGAPVLSMEDGWETAYRRRTSSKFRNQHSRRLRRLCDVGQVEFTTARAGAELDEALDESFRLHSLRWLARKDADLSGYASEAGRAFHRAAARRLAERDLVRVSVLRLDGRPISFHYWFAYRKVMTVHRVAFDPAFKDYSPGILVTLRAIEEASAEGCIRVNFLRGEEEYKLRLADEVEPVYWTAVGGPMAALRRAEMATRQRLKRSQGLRQLYDRRRRAVVTRAR